MLYNDKIYTMICYELNKMKIFYLIIKIIEKIAMTLIIIFTWQDIIFI